MKNIKEVKISMDHITVTSDDRRRIRFQTNIIEGYRYLGRKPINSNQDEYGYKVFHEYQHKHTKNKVHVFTDRAKEAYFLPNLTIKFFPTWENKLIYGEVVRVLNYFIEKYNCSFNLSQYHVAIDLFSEENNLKSVVSWMKSGRKYDPPEHPKYPGTHYFHSTVSHFNLIAYDKKKEVISKENISNKALKKLNSCNVMRVECRFKYSLEIYALPDLGRYCFDNLMSNRFNFLMPDADKLQKQGIDSADVGLKGLRRLLKDKGVKHNLFYYTRENTALTHQVLYALKQFRWGKPEYHPLLVPKLIIRPQRVKYIQH